MADVHMIGADALRDAVLRIFVAAGCAEQEAARIAHYLVAANLVGHDSHGVVRVPRYVQQLRDGKVLAGQTLTVVRDGPVHALVDGNYGFGQTVAPLAVDVGIAKARAAGIAVIGLRNAGHIGRIGDWAERAAEAGLVSVHFVNVKGGELVAPFGGTGRRFSTNPLCIGAPQPDGAPPLLLDFATSTVAEGKVLVASNGGKPVPPDALVGADGTISGDPRLLYGDYTGTHHRDVANGTGAIRAFGDHKGSGIAFMCEMLAGCLTGGGTSGPIEGGRRGRIANGMLSIYLDPAHFAGAGFAQAARDYALYVKSAAPIPPNNEVLVPGEPEHRTRLARSRAGIPLAAGTWAAINETAQGLSLAL